MKFGIQLTSIYDADTDARRQRREHEEIVRLCEQLGFDLMSVGQHYLGAELRYFQPVPWLAYMSTMAPSMRTNTGIILLSMVNPVDIAEQMATLDVLTEGKAIFGVGLGYSSHEFAAFGVAPGTRVARFEEALKLVRLLWSGKPVDFHGRFFTVEGACPAVRPLQRGGLPVWIGGQASGAVRRAARLGDAWYAPPFPTHDELIQLRRLFVQTRAQHGLPTSGDFPVRRELLIAPSKQAALEGALARYRARYDTYRKWGLAGENTPVERDGQQVRTDIEAHFILGPAQQCAAALKRLETECGMTHFMFKPQWPGLPHREAMKQIEEFGTKVLPALAG
jgi:alkanesulfonate monooxygenase SsuD/methylene tetrahydromethanopterin reductase-like flavin-dependent oxidoreductase (luciferase family)